MTPAEIVIAEVGGFLLLGAVLAVGREALKKNWIKLSFSASIAPPDGRWPRKAVTEEPAAPVAETAPLREVG